MTLRSLLFYALFWGLVFLLNVGPEWHKYSSAKEVLEVVGSTTLLQAMVALIVLWYLVPKWLDQGKVNQFVIAVVLLLFVAAEMSVLFSYLYLEPAYPDTYGKFYQILKQQGVLERLGYSNNIKYILFSKLPLFFFPAAVLTAVQYYKKQQALITLKEQQRVAELEALKHQINPHFIFNTLNNIYALALQKSDQTSEAVEKLSGILDYVLYRCGGEHVSLNDEVLMIQDYIALERLRFGDRVSVEFTNQAEGGLLVAPLLFLTLLENAFKHGVSQELNVASIKLALRSTENQVEFTVCNSKPRFRPAEAERKGIGLANLKRQLQLLYPDAHSLKVEQDQARFQASLTLVAS